MQPTDIEMVLCIHLLDFGVIISDQTVLIFLTNNLLHHFLPTITQLINSQVKAD